MRGEVYLLYEGRGTCTCHSLKLRTTACLGLETNPSTMFQLSSMHVKKNMKLNFNGFGRLFSIRSYSSACAPLAQIFKVNADRLWLVDQDFCSIIQME